MTATERAALWKRAAKYERDLYLAVLENWFIAIGERDAARAALARFVRLQRNRAPETNPETKPEIILDECQGPGHPGCQWCR